MDRQVNDIGPRLNQTLKTDAPHRVTRWLFLRLCCEATKRQDIVNNPIRRMDNYIAPRASWCYSALLLSSCQLRTGMIGTAVFRWSFADGQYSSDFGDAG
jgi:hypothetical protein